MAFNTTDVRVRDTNFVGTLDYIVQNQQQSTGSIAFTRRGELNGGRFMLRGTLTSTGDVAIRRVVLLLSSTATSHSSPQPTMIRLSGPDGSLDARIGGNLPMQSTIRTVGDEPLGRGPRVPIPTHVTYEATGVQLHSGQPQSWELSLTASAPAKGSAK